MVGFVAPTSAAAEESVQPRWSESVVPYYVNALNSDVSPEAARSALAAGALTWSSHSDANVTFAYAGDTWGTAVEYNLKNEVLFRNASDENDAIATTYTWRVADVILDTDIVFWDGAYRFFAGTDECTDGFFIEDIAAHEFGHAAGLSHSETEGATMYPRVARCSSELRSLASSDLEEIQARYPAVRAPRPLPLVGPVATVDPDRPVSSVVLSWTTASLDGSYHVVERSTDGAEFVAVAVVSGERLSYVDRPLAADTTYWYRVRVRRDGVESRPSPPAFVRTLPGPLRPDAPSAPTPEVGLTEVGLRPILSWAPSDRATSYDIYLGTSSPAPLYLTDSFATALALPEVTGGTTFYWRVVAKNAAGESSASPWSFTTVRGAASIQNDGGSGVTKRYWK